MRTAPGTTSPDWLTGEALRVEDGVVGIAFLLATVAASSRLARGRCEP